jgi:CheY-like chemotaxis protein
MSKASILVVDDEPFNLDIVAEYLDEMDFDLVMVESGEAAWDEAEPSRKRFSIWCSSIA